MMTITISRYHSLLYRALFLMSFFLFLGFQPPQPNNIFTESELHSLPDLIQLKLRYHLGGNKDKQMLKLIRHYTQIYGAGYFTVHHFGKGLIYLNRAQFNATNTTYKARMLKYAIEELGYALDPNKLVKWGNNKAFETTFVYLMYSKRGEAYMQQGNLAAAASDFMHSINIMPSYANAYVSLSQCYRRIGDTRKADEILKKLHSRPSVSK